jgi:membrane fusion protein, heavy metal efflux system
MNRIAILFFSCLLIAGCNSGTQSPAEDAGAKAAADRVSLTQEQIALLSLTTGKVERRSLANNIKVTGVLDVPPQNLVTISAPLGGFVKYTHLLQGMRVKKGEVIATMEHPDYIQLQQDYLDSKNQLEFLALEYKRQQELAAENINAAKTLQQAKSNYVSMQVRVEGLQSKLRLINISPQEMENGKIKNTISIVAPISGYVTQVNVNPGMYANPTQVMFKIADTDHLHAEAQVFEKDVMKIKTGQRVLLMLPYEERPRIAKVYLIGKEISNERTVRVHCHFEKEDPSLIPGMYFSAFIEVGEDLVDAVPAAAVATFEGNSYLFVRESQTTYRLVEIKTGISDSGFTEVILPPGFDPNTEIVVNGTYALISKLKNAEEE